MVNFIPVQEIEIPSQPHSPKEVLTAILEMAKQNATIYKFDMNDVKMRVYPTDTIETVKARYETAVRLRAPLGG